MTTTAGHTTEAGYEAELYAACLADRTPGTALHDRCAAQDRIEHLLAAADRDGFNLYSRFYAIDEQARLALYPA